MPVGLYGGVVKLVLGGVGSPDPLFHSPFLVEHDLVGHPLLERSALAALASRLPRASIEISHPEAPVVAGADYKGVFLEDADPHEAVMTLPGRRQSVFLLHVEADDEYAGLVSTVLDAVQGLCGVDPGDVTAREGYVFLAGDRAVTSAHVDHECNVLMITEGTKRVWLAEVGDPAGERALEALHSGRYGACDARPASLRSFDLVPGQGVFIPPRAAHYVENGPGACIAMSAVFQTRRVQAERPVYAWNARLRRLGLTPTPPDRSPWRDRLKQDSFRVATTLKSLRHRTTESVSPPA